MSNFVEKDAGETRYEKVSAAPRAAGG